MAHPLAVSIGSSLWPWGQPEGRRLSADLVPSAALTLTHVGSPQPGHSGHCQALRWLRTIPIQLGIDHVSCVWKEITQEASLEAQQVPKAGV